LPQRARGCARAIDSASATAWSSPRLPTSFERPEGQGDDDAVHITPGARERDPQRLARTTPGTTPVMMNGYNDHPGQHGHRCWLTPWARGQMEHQRPAVHRTILVVDVEGFGDQRRTNPHRLAVRDGMYRALQQAFSHVGIPWAECYQESCGDGVFVLIPAEVPKGIFIESMPRELAEALREHNAGHRAEEPFRLLDAGPLKSALAESPGTLALIVSSWFFDEVVRHSQANDAATYRRVRVAVKETTAVAWICRPDQPYPPDDKELEAVPTGLATPVPRQLPAHAPHFVGRDDELSELTQLLEVSAPGWEPIAVLAIDGTAGGGKTALALRWANQVAQRFPDGQLYVNLRGFDPSGAPMAPAEAVRGFLDAFGIPADRMPAGGEAQARLYRSMLAGRRV